MRSIFLRTILLFRKSLSFWEHTLISKFVLNLFSHSSNYILRSKSSKKLKPNNIMHIVIEKDNSWHPYICLVFNSWRNTTGEEPPKLVLDLKLGRIVQAVSYYKVVEVLPYSPEYEVVGTERHHTASRFQICDITERPGKTPLICICERGKQCSFHRSCIRPGYH